MPPQAGGALVAQPAPARKRRRSNDNGYSDDDDSSHSDAETGRLWACPFYKLDPWTHYRCMEKYKFKRYADVKQHILRRHTVPGPNCLSNDETAALRTMPPDRRDWQKWYRMWDNLFQGHQRPSSPYISHGIAEPIALLRSHAGPSLVAGLPPLLEALRIRVDADMIALLQTGIERMVFEASSAPQRARLRPTHPTALGAGHASPLHSPPPPNGEHLHGNTVQIGTGALISPSQTPHGGHPTANPGAMASNTDAWAAESNPIDLLAAVEPLDEYLIFDYAFDGQSDAWDGPYQQF